MPALALSRISSLIILEAANFWNRHPSNNCLPPGTWECFLRHFLLPHFNFSSINNVQSTNDDRPFPEAQNLWNTRLLHWTYDRNNSYHSQWICRITGNSRLQKVHSFQWQDHTLTEKLHLTLVPGPRGREDPCLPKAIVGHTVATYPVHPDSVQVGWSHIQPVRAHLKPSAAMGEWQGRQAHLLWGLPVPAVTSGKHKPAVPSNCTLFLREGSCTL